MTNYLVHHGILGQKWGIRRFQNEDGSLTPAGKKRYDVDVSRQTGRIQRESISKLSDRELIDRLNRVRAEKQYAELTEELYRPGRRRAKNLGSQALERMVKQPFMNAAGNFIEKTLSKSLNVLASSIVGETTLSSSEDFIKQILS